MINFRLNSIFSAALCQLLLFHFDLLGDKWYLPLSILHMGMHPCPLEQLQPCCEQKHTQDHDSSYFPSFFSLFHAPSSLCHFAVDITELCRDKEAEKNNNRPIDPYFTNLGGMGEIHLQGWNRPADWASIGFLLGSSRSTAEGPDCCHFWVRMFLWWCRFTSNLLYASGLKQTPDCIWNQRENWISVRRSYTAIHYSTLYLIKSAISSYHSRCICF